MNFLPLWLLLLLLLSLLLSLSLSLLFIVVVVIEMERFTQGRIYIAVNIPITTTNLIVGGSISRLLITVGGCKRCV